MIGSDQLLEDILQGENQRHCFFLQLLNMNKNIHSNILRHNYRVNIDNLISKDDSIAKLYKIKIIKMNVKKYKFTTKKNHKTFRYILKKIPLHL